MSDSTPYIYHLGICRPAPVLPVRHPMTEAGLRAVSVYACIGDADSCIRRGWVTLLSVHGEQAVLRGLRRCAAQISLRGRITSDHVLAVLDLRHDQREGPGALRRTASVTASAPHPRTRVSARR